MYKSQYDPDWYHHHHLYSHNHHQLLPGLLQWFCRNIICWSRLIIFPSDKIIGSVTKATKKMIWKTNCYFPVRRQFYIHIIITKNCILRWPKITKRNRHCFDKNKTPVRQQNAIHQPALVSLFKDLCFLRSVLTEYPQVSKTPGATGYFGWESLVVAVLWSKYVYVSTYLMEHNNFVKIFQCYFRMLTELWVTWLFSC